MEKKADPEERTRNLVSYAFLVSPLVYLLLIFEIRSFKSFHYAFGDSMPEFTYLMIAIGFLGVARAKPIHVQILNARKKDIHTLKEFNAVFFSSSMIRLAFLTAPGIYGLLVFLLTGSLVYSIFLILLSMAGLIIFFPRNSEKDERMKQFHFDEPNR